MKCSFGISDVLEEIPRLSHSVVFLYFFALIAEEGFLISPCYSLELCIQMLNLSFSPLIFASLLFIAICKASSDSHFAFLHFFFLGMVWFLFPVQCHDHPSIVHQALCLSDPHCCSWEAVSRAAAERSYPMSKVRSSGCALVEQPWRDTPRLR